MMAIDTSARPHELLALRVGDIKIKQSPTTGKTYAEVEIGRGGKTKSRIVAMFFSLPYYRAWLEQHPMAQSGSNPDAFLFLSQENSAMYRNLPLQADSVRNIYRRMKQEYLPLLLDRPDVPADDKVKIRELLKKPFNPYIFRHTSLTEKAQIMKNSYLFNLHAGWTKGSKMVEVYTHELGGESSRDLFMAYGVLDEKDVIGKEGDGSSSSSKHQQLLQYKQCPHCSIDKKRDAKFCINCKFVLSFDAFTEAVEEKDKTAREAEEAKKKLEELEVEQKRMAKNINTFIENFKATEAKLLNYEIQERGKIIIHNGEKVKALLDEDNGDVIAYQKITHLE
jgi:integrase/recombinase XerD